MNLVDTLQREKNLNQSLLVQLPTRDVTLKMNPYKENADVDSCKGGNFHLHPTPTEES